MDDKTDNEREEEKDVSDQSKHALEDKFGLIERIKAMAKETAGGTHRVATRKTD